MLEESVWYVHDLFTKTYMRNRRWWAEVGQPAYEKFWRDVETARRDGTYNEKPMFMDESSDDESVESVKDVWEGVTTSEEEKERIE